MTVEQTGPTDNGWGPSENAVVAAFHEIVGERLAAFAADPSISRLDTTGEHARTAVAQLAEHFGMPEDEVLRVVVAEALVEEAIEERDEAGHRYIIPVDGDKFIRRDSASPDQIRAYRDSLVEERDQAHRDRAYLWSLIPDASDGTDGDRPRSLVKVENASRQQLEDACFDFDLEIAALDRDIEFWTGQVK